MTDSRELQGRIFGGTVFGDHVVGNTADIVIGISKFEKYGKDYSIPF